MDIHVCVYIYIYVHIELQRFSCVSNSNTICANKHKHIYIHNKRYNVTDDRGGWHAVGAGAQWIWFWERGVY